MKFFKFLFSLSLLVQSLGFANDYYEETDSCNNVYFTVDYLFWKAHVDQLEYAIDGLNIPLSSGEAKELDWKWDSGFKAGVGYLFSDSGWDIYLNYTRFHTKASGSATPEPGNALYPTFANPFLLSINFASSQFELNYNTLDLELGNTFCFTPSLLIHPSFGLRGAWTEDKDDIIYDVLETIHLSENFRGVGPRVGLNVVWNFCNGFSLFGEGNYALIWGKNRSRFLSLNPLVAADTRQDYFTLRHLTDIRIGLGWDYCFCQSRLKLELAWEHRLWLDYNQYLHFFEDFNVTHMPNSSPLSLYGFTLRACYVF